MPPKGSKRKRPSAVADETAPTSPPPNFVLEQASKHLADPSAAASSTHIDPAQPHPELTNPDLNPEVLDSKEALRASPDAEEGEHVTAAGEEVDVRGQGDTEMMDVGKVTGTRGRGRGRGGAARGGRGRGKAVTNGSGVDATTLEANGVKVDDMAFTGGEGSGTAENGVKREESPLSELEDVNEQGPPAKKPKKTPTKTALAAKKANDEIKAFKAAQAAAKKEKAEAEKAVKKEDDDGHGSAVGGDGDNDGEGADEHKDDVDTVKQEARRPPPVNSDYLPLPWKGRLGYACLNTYLRFSNPPVFSSRTCRIASILEHRHPLKDPSQPEHATKNRPDTTQPASVRRGMEYVEALGLQNARDIPKMIRWNAKYGIRFMRLSSEMFPFASHEEYGYKLASFAKETLEEAGKVAAEFNCRLTTHPGQYTQLGSPRPSVIENAIRDLEYHDEMLSLLNLPEQLNKDAVMILHLGGTFGDKEATLQRFKDNYIKLPQSVKNRLVLENDDVSWSVHDLLPVCEELNIPMVLDYHHHNIIFDSTKLREGTKDIMELYPRIRATWERKGITQKMHYSEPCPEAVTGRERRKHNPRPATLPPCVNDMDLMIEAKDKEQALFEIMRSLKLPGWDTFNNIVPYERDDENKPEPKRPKKKPKKKTKKQLAAEAEDPSLIEPEETEEEPEKVLVPEEEVGMGGPENRVYWPPGMEEWLRPKKREVKKKNKDGDDFGEGGVMGSDLWAFAHPNPMNVAQRKAAKARMEEQAKAAGETEKPLEMPVTPAKASNGSTKAKANGGKKATPAKRVKKADSDQESVASTMTESPEELEEDADFSAEETDKTPATVKSTGSVNRNGSRRTAIKKATYREDSGSEMDVD